MRNALKPKWFLYMALLFCCTLSTLAAAESGAEPPAPAEEPAASPEAIPEEEPLFNAGPIPEPVRRPQRGESPRYPRDVVIGELGQGQAPERAYQLARRCLTALAAGNQDSTAWAEFDPLRREEAFAGAGHIAPRNFRLGGGREEADGGVSFLFRLLGREQSIAGELYLKLEEETWRPDDIILEEPREITGKVEVYGFDFSPYERFF
jgi:hypothetical protein